MTLKGLTITDSHILSLETGVSHQGAAARIYFGRAILEDVIFADNSTAGPSVAGAALSMIDGVLRNCRFIGNKAYGSLPPEEPQGPIGPGGGGPGGNPNPFPVGTVTPTASGSGAAMRVSGARDLVIDNCHFEGNKFFDMDYSSGGAISIAYADENSKALISNSTFIDHNGQNGGAIRMGGAENGFGQIINCTFENNGYEEKSEGGAIFAHNNLSVISSRFIANQTEYGGSAIYMEEGRNNQVANVLIEQSIFKNNTDVRNSNSYEAAIEFTDNFNVTISNCEISNNNCIGIRYNNTDEDLFTLTNNPIVKNTRGGVSLGASENTIQNNIIWSNESFQLNGTQSEDLVEYNLIQGGYDGLQNIDADPLFISEDLFLLTPDSPCLNAGTLNIDVKTDIQDMARPAPANSFPDLGAYEFDQYFAFVNAKFFFDENENGTKEAEEQYMKIGSITDSDGTLYKNHRVEGIFLVVQPGEVRVTYTYENVDWELSGAITEYDFIVEDVSFEEVIEFGLKPRKIYSKVKSTIIGDRFRCGEEIAFRLLLDNEGTKVEDGQLYLEIDSRLDQYSFEIEPDFINGNIISWNFEDLYPFEQRTISFKVIAPLIDDPDQIGELYAFGSWQNIDGADNDNEFTLKAELRCAFDPNDKQVFPSRPDQLALIDEALTYTIRFQNTGNDFARNVVVRDTLDDNLDPRTFRLLHTSHPDFLQVILKTAIPSNLISHIST